MALARRLRTLLHTDASVSEVLGTVLLTATTVVLLGGFGVVLLASTNDTADPPAGAFSIEADDGAAFVDLRFVSGSAFPLEGARIVLLVNGSDQTGTASLVNPALAGTFSPGDTLRVDLASGTLPVDADVRVLVVDGNTGKPIGTTVATLLSASTLPPFVTGTPSLATISFEPTTLTVDGTSLTNVTVHVVSPFGLDLVRSVTLNLTRVGGPAEAALLDDGQGADVLADDGIYTTQIAAVEFEFAVAPSTEAVRIPVLLRDIFGKTAEGEGTLTLETGPLSRVAAGAKWRDIPASDAVNYVNLTDVTFRDTTVLGGDQVQIRVSDLDGTGDAWTALVTFASPATCGTTEPGVVSVQLSRDGVAGNATYTPSGSTCFSLGALSDLNIANPPTSVNATGDVPAWSVSGNPSTFLYMAAGISETNEAAVTFLGDAFSPAPSALGLGQADLEWARILDGVPTALFSRSTSGLTVNVDASASTDPEGGALTYEWDWGDTTTSTTSTPTTSHLYPRADNFTITLTVKDPDLKTDSTTAAVQVNRAPTARFTTATSGLQVDVDGTLSSDPDTQNLVHVWNWGDGQTTTGGVTASHTYAAGGTYTVTLTVTDTFLATDTETASVSPVGNVAPTATLSSNATAGTAPLDVRFSLGGSDSDGSIASWTLVYGDGSTSATGTGLSTTRDKQYAFPGSYQANLTVTDDDGATHTASVTISVNARPTATLSATPTSGAAPLATVFTLGGSDTDGSIASWTLSFGDGTSSSGTVLPIIQGKTYNASGTYQANLTVTDDDGATHTTSVTITVSAPGNLPPVAGLSANATSGNTPLSVRLSLSGTDADGTIASWSLDYGDGSTAATGTGLPTTRDHAYAAGAHTAQLTVTDDDGATHTASVAITVNAYPTSTLSANVTSGTGPLVVGLTLGGSDGDGSVASWTLAYGDGTTATGTSLPATFSKTYAAGGYTATLTVTDDDGAQTVARVGIFVNARPTASLAITGTSDLNVTASAAGSADADGTLTTYTWQWGDGTTTTTAVPTAVRPYATGGSYTVNLTVTDNFTAVSAAVSASAAPNRPPVIASATATAPSDLNATLNASASDPDGDSITYTFAWGDGTAATTGSSASASHQFARAGNFTVTVYANDTLGGSASTTKLVSVTQTVYASAAATDFSAPGGSAVSIGSITADDSSFANFAETNTASAESAVSGCNSSFTTQAPLSCTLSGLTWKVNSTSTGGTAAWTMSLDASQGNPTADGALALSPNSNGANTGIINYYFNTTGAAATTLTRLTVDWKMTANGGTGLRSLTAVLVAPNGTAVTIGTTSTTTNTAWGTFTANVNDDWLKSSGTYLLRIDYLSSKNGDVLNLDNLYLNWTASNTYRLQKELTIYPVSTDSGLLHHLEVSARQLANNENLAIQVFDGLTWTTRANVTSATVTTYVANLTAAEVNGGNVRVRLVDATTSGDATASTWLIDYVRVVTRGA